MTAKLSLQSSADAPAIAGDWIMDHCRQAALEGTPSFHVMTCVVEAVNNCIEHAYRGSSGEIRIRLFRSARWLVVQIQDRGQPVNRQPAQADPDPMQLGGRGWFIMQQWMDIARYRRCKRENVVTLVKCLG